MMAAIVKVGLQLLFAGAMALWALSAFADAQGVKR